MKKWAEGTDGLQEAIEGESPLGAKITWLSEKNLRKMTKEKI